MEGTKWPSREYVLGACKHLELNKNLIKGDKGEKIGVVVVGGIG